MVEVTAILGPQYMQGEQTVHRLDRSWRALQAGNVSQEPSQVPPAIHLLETNLLKIWTKK